MDPLISRRALNRATLDRQFLLARTDRGVLDVVEHLGGLQAQTPHTWYTGLWTRIADFDPAVAGELLMSRALVRIALQRSTIHLVTARDCLAMRPLLQPVTARMTRTTFGKRLAGVDMDELAEAGRELLESRPMTFAELGRELAARWPSADPHALGQGVRSLVPLVQVPPRGVWGRSGTVAHTSAESWLGFETPAMTAGELVRRYLAAFGPASVKDVQTWSGLTRLSEVVETLDLVRFRDESGRVLYDLPDAPRPPEDVPAPARFMYDFDNLFLSHTDRSRVISDLGAGVLTRFAGTNVQPRAVLVDGFTAADWTYRSANGLATLNVHQWQPLTAAEREEVEREAMALLGFLTPDDKHEVAFFGASSMG
ncbi:winged helix DNA-binding domain-containing protein [Actinomadura sp. ATCC 31491]|uniref:Winged helix DNA-binding domain-containing protein n=1 Tax=Actinomadura luzonensis TaxID=2805427 RepID=A0ABT0FKX7_9ACTN|nr:winged helix DNA-binding domain-containing protein [Actinomadura luzonensis]MCK2212626.1 winged helix DNA-binding domain-containing protein [Actinomadura luzonensis]